MRQIKFRAWNKTESKMVDLYKITPLALDANTNTQLAIRGESGLFIPFSDEIRLMQFTGLTDKNGVEVYEGDIIDMHGKRVVVGEIDWNCGCCNIVYGYVFDYGDWYGAVIIGNIHENPELLEEE